MREGVTGALRCPVRVIQEKCYRNGVGRGYLVAVTGSTCLLRVYVHGAHLVSKYIL